MIGASGVCANETGSEEHLDLRRDAPVRVDEQGVDPIRVVGDDRLDLLDDVPADPATSRRIPLNRLEIDRDATSVRHPDVR